MQLAEIVARLMSYDAHGGRLPENHAVVPLPVGQIGELARGALIVQDIEGGVVALHWFPNSTAHNVDLNERH